MSLHRILASDVYADLRHLVQQQAYLEVLSRINFTIDDHINLPNRYLIEEESAATVLSKLGDVYQDKGCITVIHSPDHMVLIAEMDDQRHDLLEIYLFSNSNYAEANKQKVLEALNPYKLTGKGVDISWGIYAHKKLEKVEIYNDFYETIMDEAYPYIEGGLQDYIGGYLSHSASILLLWGKPGTGKTRFARRVAQHIGQLKNRNARVLYTTDIELLNKDSFIIELLSDDFDMLLLEDADMNLKSRTDDNPIMHKILAASDGFVQHDKKIIFTSNLPNVKNIDEALLREGRCYDTIEFRALTAQEATAFLKTLVPETTHVYTDDTPISRIYDDAGELGYIGSKGKTYSRKRRRFGSFKETHFAGFGL